MPEAHVFGSGFDTSTVDGWPEADVHNAREAAWARGVPAAEVLRRLDAAHADALEVLGSLTAEEEADERFREDAASRAAHHDLHRAELEALLRS